MNVPFQLRKRVGAEPATALLLLHRGTDVPRSPGEEVLAVCARLGGARRAIIHAVADGFLLLPQNPVTAVVPRTIRLRSLCPNLFVPADADLVPALHDDEARGLVRDRGLVFLPGGRVLAFAPNEPLPLRSLIAPGAVQRPAAQPFPQPRQLAERIETILLDLPLPPPEEMLDAGAEDIGSEDPRPEGAGMLDTIAGTVQSAAGKGLMGLGNLFGLKGLAKLGAGMVASAVTRVPRLTESILGQQEAALRELLRLFQSGELDKALRRALPLGGPGGRGGVAATDSRLPVHNLAYSLGNLLGRGGPASIWFGGHDVQRDLAIEYRKAADAAVRRGDYRRAAFIYGRLLQDYRRAADVLFQGGLYQDAALLYLKKVDDRAAAARAFELAGETDHAVQLYRQLGDHAMAGDVLRRAGEEEKAFAEYTIAADKLVDRHDFLAAADLMKMRALRPDIAQKYLERGWSRRPTGNSLACAVRLAQLHADRQDAVALTRLVADARPVFDVLQGAETTAAQFYNSVAVLAGGPGLAGVRDELRDSALLGLAVKVRQRLVTEARPGDIVSRLLASTWPAAVVSDAQFAVNAHFKQPKREPQPRQLGRVSLGTGSVTAACGAMLSGDVFVGFENGEIVGFCPRDGARMRVAAGDGVPVRALSTSLDGQVLVANQQRHDPNSGAVAYSFITCHVRKLGSWELGVPSQESWDALGLAQGVARDVSGWTWCAWDSEGLIFGKGLFPQPLPLEGKLAEDWWPNAALLLPARSQGVASLLCFRASLAWVQPLQHDLTGYSSTVTNIGWTPQPHPESTLWHLPISWLRAGDNLEVAGLNVDGSLKWTKLHINGWHLENVASFSSKLVDDGYRAATIIGRGLLAAVAQTRIHWFRTGTASRMEKTGETPADLTHAVACFASLSTGELLVVCSDGELVRVPLPS
jgi:tetratricopeptide (TPR) repeat protein